MQESDLKEQTQIQDKDSAQDTDVTSKENSSGLWWIWLIIIITAVLIFAVGVWYKKKRL